LPGDTFAVRALCFLPYWVLEELVTMASLGNDNIFLKDEQLISYKRSW
jgi:hypothetical protein